MKKKQNIKCEVDTCKHNTNKQECNLDEVKISSSCDCPNDEVCDCEETTCASFEKNEEED